MPTVKAHISLRLDLDVNAKIKYIAKKECRSAANKINYLIQQEIERYEDENGPIKVSDDDLYN